MKILILGDYSSFGYNLKKGFLKLGHEVDILSDGDGWKKINSEGLNLKYNMKNKITRYVSGMINRIKIIKFLENKSYDIILIMNENFLSRKVKIIKNLIMLRISIDKLKEILNKNGKIYMLACGSDLTFYNYCGKYEEKKGYYIYNKSESEKLLKKEKKKRDKNFDKNLLEKIDGVIPVMYDYAEAYRNSSWQTVNKIKKTIPLCIDLENTEVLNELKEKIVIFHGISREDFKGTYFIRKAMENIKEKYPDKVEIIIDGKMPLEKYKKLLKKTNIIIDQCKSFGYGMNALYGMSMGKLVFSGNELENEIEFEKKDIPVVNIIPDIEDIEKKLEYFILNPKLIIETGNKARKFVEEFHEAEIVASQYIKLYNNDKMEEK